MHTMTSIEAVRILCVVGARPNFMKIAPLMRAFAQQAGLSATLVHTGQHYDPAMKASFFEELDIPEPDVDLGVGSGSHAVQTAEVMRRFESVLEGAGPDAVLVVGDVNSTIACALVAAKRGVPVIHVEAGLRSYDRGMPEEINRVLTDQLSDLLFTTEEGARVNLLREGIDPGRIRFVGNVMIDTLFHNLERSQSAADVIAGVAGVELPIGEAYGLLTLHRPSNVDDPVVLERILGAVVTISTRLPIIFPVHPRTAARLESTGLDRRLGPRILRMPPLRYLDMLGLLSKARVVLTDSGGVQEETTALGVACLTLRENTERPITVTAGTNTVVGTDPQAILAAFDELQRSGGKGGQIPPLWDGHAAERIAAEILRWARERRGTGGGRTASAPFREGDREHG
jgi:UDP-N-acetylglucosamine 2-epimerase (non-hydrolysing)